MTNRWHTLTICYAHKLKVMPERVTLAPPIWRLDEEVLLNGRAVMPKGVIDGSLQNFQCLQMHKFYTMCAKKFAPMIGPPEMTSE